MKKTPTQKRKYTKRIKSTDTSAPQETKGTYHLKMKVNDREHECDTDDLKKSIMEFKPLFVKTRVFFTITKDGKTAEKQVFTQRAKMMFRNDTYMNLFLRHLIFK